MLSETIPDLIDEGKSIEENYISLLKRARDAQRSDEAGSTVCRHCGNQLASHLSDKRCSVDAMSAKFCASDILERDRVRRAISLIECLYDL